MQKLIDMLRRIDREQKKRKSQKLIPIICISFDITCNWWVAFRRMKNELQLIRISDEKSILLCIRKEILASVYYTIKLLELFDYLFFLPAY